MWLAAQVGVVGIIPLACNRARVEVRAVGGCEVQVPTCEAPIPGALPLCLLQRRWLIRDGGCHEQGRDEANIQFPEKPMCMLEIKKDMGWIHIRGCGFQT